MSAIARIRALPSYQILLLGIALTIVIGQSIAMAIIAHGQVERARAFYAERDRLAKAAQDAREAHVALAAQRRERAWPRQARADFDVATLQASVAR